MTALEAAVMSEHPDNPGVIAKPPLIALACIGLGLAADWALPVPVLPSILSAPARLGIGAVLFASGIVILALAVGRFAKAGTSFRTEKPSTALVTDGLYRYSRNPIYIGLTTAYIGVGIAANSLWVLGLAVLFLALIRYGVIAREERYLEAKFGEAYRIYRIRVRRWL